MDNELTLGSLFDGSGGFPLGGLLCGITPAWASEIEPFPIRVTTKRLPQMKHYGDISTMDGRKIEPVDIITFGSPCTDMSIAGKRSGLDGKQSVLFYEAIRIVREMREATNGAYPRYICWENVPGAFSSNRGEDFQSVLEAVIQIACPQAKVPAPENGRWPYADLYLGDGWSVAYRTLDAQYFGVPQRRRRIYLVADFAGECAGEILFEPKGVSRNFTSGGYPWKRAATDAADGAGTASLCLNDQGGSRMDVSEGTTATLRAEAHHPPVVMESSGFCTEHSAKSRGVGYEKERSPTLRAGIVPGVAIENHPTDGRVKLSDDGTVQTLTSRMGTGGMNTPLVLDAPTVFGICSDKSNSMLSNNPHSGVYEAETARTLDANGGNPGCNQGGIAVVEGVPFTQNQRNEVRLLGNKSCALCKAATKQQTYLLQGSMIGREDRNGPQGCGVSEDVSFTLNTSDRHAVAYSMTTGCYSTVSEEQTSTLMARDFKDVPLVSQPYQRISGTVATGAHPSGFNGQDAYNDRLIPCKQGSDYIVRRLTPTECARLQGFPDWWCDDLGTEHPTEEEVLFWTEVWETHRKIMGTSAKPKSRKQILKWLLHPHSDAAEYKMWGNGVAANCVIFVLAGIVAEYAKNIEDI